jgi:hypothetical protein
VEALFRFGCKLEPRQPLRVALVDKHLVFSLKGTLIARDVLRRCHPCQFKSPVVVESQINLVRHSGRF